MEFRQDINGLRALAVLVVVLFHFGLAPVSGGFAGVDVFFVISGYLMTGIVFSRMEQGRFSLPDFWLARGRRILPALLAVCATLLLLGWFRLSPMDYKMLGKHALYSVTFLSNFIYQGESGYFDAASQDKWLLHTWSLSVEWQFYMLYPLWLLGARAVSRHPRAPVWAVWAAFAASLAASAVWTARAPTQAYFQLAFRAWELLAGALVFLHAPRLQASPGQRSALALAGLAAIVCSCLHFTHDTPWPGMAALLPVGGAALVIAAARHDLWLTGNPVAQALGRWSYSIYLWHWPVWAALAYYGAHRQPAAIAAGIAASVVLGMLSFRLVEQPAARLLNRSGTRPRVALALSAACAAVLLPAGLVYVLHGVEQRLSPKVLAIAKEDGNRFKDRVACEFHPGAADPLPRCVLGDRKDVRLIVWGDSHASAVVTAVAEAVPHGVAYYGYQSCPTATGVHYRGWDNTCVAFNEAVLADMRALPPQAPVLIVNRFASYVFGKDAGNPEPVPGVVMDDEPQLSTRPELEAAYKHRLIGMLCRVRQTGREVFVLESLPEMTVYVPNHLARALLRGERPDDVKVSMADYRARNAVVGAWLQEARTTCGVRLLDPTPYLCADGWCGGSRRLQPLYFDTNHLSERGNRVLLPLFRQAFGGLGARKLAAQPAATGQGG